MNITTVGDSSLYQISVANISGNYTVDVYEPVRTAVVTCASIVVSASAVSMLYGESDFSIYNRSTSVFKGTDIHQQSSMRVIHYSLFISSLIPMQAFPTSPIIEGVNWDEVNLELATCI